MSRVNPWVWFGLAVAGVWFVATRAKAQNAAGSAQLTASGLPIQAGTQAIPELPGSLAPQAAALTSAGSFWDLLTPVNALDSGYINFPSASQAAASTFRAGNTRMDGNGNYYVQWGGLVYRLGMQDSSGNWPAQVVASI